MNRDVVDEESWEDKQDKCLHFVENDVLSTSFFLNWVFIKHGKNKPVKNEKKFNSTRVRTKKFYFKVR